MRRAAREFETADIGCKGIVFLSKTNHNKTNQIHNISNLFNFGTALYMFQTVSPPIIRSLRLYIEHQVYVIQVLLSAC